MVKNKVAPPFKRCEFDIMFGEGISRSSEIIDLGVEYGIIKKSGSWFSYNDAKLAQGRDAAKKVIEDNPELADELEDQIMAALNESKGGNNKPAVAKKPTVIETKDADNDDELDIDDINFDDEDFSIEEDV